MRLSKPTATKLIRDAAENTSLVFFTAHARERMAKRSITGGQIIKVLKSGAIIEGPFNNIAHGNWECLIQGYSAGVNMQVKVAIETNDKNVLIVTVYKVG